MIIYTIILAILSIAAVFVSDEPKNVFTHVLIYLPIFGRIFGWW